MFMADATLSEYQFRRSVKDALDNPGLMLSDWTPWGDTSEALEAIALSPRPVPRSLVLAAWAAYRTHVPTKPRRPKTP